MDASRLEDIAALIDGTLPPEERTRVMVHLRRCEMCYEVFEEMARDEDTTRGGVIQFPLVEERAQEKHARVEPTRPARRASWWLPLAASVVLAVGLGALAWRYFAAPSTMDVADLAAPFQKKPGLTGSLYQGEIYRNLPEESADFLPDEHAFLAGVYLMGLHLSVQAGDSDQASKALHSLGGEVKEIMGSGDLGDRYQRESASLESEEGLQEFAGRLSDEEKNTWEHLSLYEPFYSFGLWAEAGRRAAEVKSSKFFETRRNRRYLSHLQKVLPEELAEELRDPVLDDLKDIERIWDEGDFSAQDFPTLATHFQDIIQRIDNYQEGPLGVE